jgi:hypothetical protein
MTSGGISMQQETTRLQNKWAFPRKEEIDRQSAQNQKTFALELTYSFAMQARLQEL